MSNARIRKKRRKKLFKAMANYMIFTVTTPPIPWLSLKAVELSDDLSSVKIESRVNLTRRDKEV